MNVDQELLLIETVALLAIPAVIFGAGYIAWLMVA